MRASARQDERQRVTERHSWIQWEHGKGWRPEGRFSAFRHGLPRAEAQASHYTGHETTNQLSDDITTTSIRQAPPAPATCAKLDTNAGIRHTLFRPAERQNAQIPNLLFRPAVYRCPRASPPSRRPSATSKTKTTKQTQSFRAHSKSTTCRPRTSEDP